MPSHQRNCCASDTSLRERLAGLRFQRDELSKAISETQKMLSEGEPVIADAKVEGLGFAIALETD